MPPCERLIIDVLLDALRRDTGIQDKELKRLADRIARKANPGLKAFWTHDRIVFTLLAIEDVRAGHRYITLIDVWLRPFFLYLKDAGMSLRQARIFCQRYALDIEL